MTWRPGGNRAPPPKEVRKTSDVEPSCRPSRWELRDFAASYVLLSVTFGILFAGGGRALSRVVHTNPTLTGYVFALSFATAGVGFVAHELAHRMVAIGFGRAAAFRAHYGMMGLGIATALAGFIFAAPGGVYHRRDVPRRERGLIALAGPVTNLALAVLFLPVVVGAFVVHLSGFVTIGGEIITHNMLLLVVGVIGVAINCILAGFNMLPFGPLDGGKVYLWNIRVYLLVAIPSVLLGAGAYLLVFHYV